MATDIYCDKAGCRFQVNGLCRCSTITLENCTNYDGTLREKGEFDEAVEVNS